MKRLLLLSAYVFMSTLTHAQTDSLDREVPRITYMKFSGMSGAKFSLLDRDKRFILKRKLSNKEMKAHLAGNDDALKHYQNYKTLNVLKRTSRWLALGGMAAGIGMGIYGESINDKDLSNAGAYTFIGGCATFLIVYIPITVASASQARHVRDAYNQDMYKKEERYSLNIGIIPNGLGLAFNF